MKMIYDRFYQIAGLSQINLFERRSSSKQKTKQYKRATSPQRHKIKIKILAYPGVSYPACRWFLLRQTREKPLRATVCFSIEHARVRHAPRDTFDANFTRQFRLEYCWLPMPGRGENFTGLLICIICHNLSNNGCFTHYLSVILPVSSNLRQVIFSNSKDWTEK